MSTEKKNFIVVFKEHATPEQIQKFADEIDNSGGEVGHRYESVLKGFSAQLTPAHLSSFKADDLIDYIEPDSVMATQ